MASDSGPDRDHTVQTLPATESGILVVRENTPAADTSPLFNGWKNYPICLPSPYSWSHIGEEASHRLTDVKTLFSKSTDASIEVCDVPRHPSANCMRFLFVFHLILAELNYALTTSYSASKATNSQQRYPWEGFDRRYRLLLEVIYDNPEEFMEQTVGERGYATEAPDVLPSVTGFLECRLFLRHTDSRADIILGGLQTYVSEVCFRLMHVEKHGRSDPDQKNPWSVRQVGLYQRFDYEDSSSICIHIQPPKETHTRLTSALERGNSSEEPGQPDPMSLHLAFIDIAMQNWAEYVRYLDEKLVECRESVVLTEEEWKKSRKAGSDYRNYLRLQLSFRNKLLATLSAFDTNLDVIKGLQKHNKRLQTLGLITDNGIYEAFDILDQSEAQLRDLRRDTATILQAAESAAQLIKTLLDSRNDTMIENHTTAVENLVEIAETNRLDTCHMKEFAERTKKDSRTMRIATMLATLYLPSTFIATVFGMDLFHSDPVEGDGKSGYTFNVAAQIWVFAIVAMGLTGITVTSFLLWEKKLGKKEEESIEQNLDKRVNSFKIEV